MKYTNDSNKILRYCLLDAENFLQSLPQKLISKETLLLYEQALITKSNEITLQNIYRFILKNIIIKYICPIDNIQKEIQRVIQYNRRIYTVPPKTPEKRYILVPELNGLLQWQEIIVNIIDNKSNLHSLNFTNSLYDGTILCKILYYYYPKLIYLEQIAPGRKNIKIQIKDESKSSLCPCCASEQAITKHNFFLINRTVIRFFDIPIVLYPELESLNDTFSPL